MSCGKLHDEQFFRRVAHAARIVHDERARVDALEKMRRRDIGEVEGRVLPQQHHVHLLAKIDAARLAQREMIAGFVAHFERLDLRHDARAGEGEPVGRVVENCVPARLRLQEKGERRVARDVDPLDRVHLDGDV